VYSTQVFKPTKTSPYLFFLFKQAWKSTAFIILKILFLFSKAHKTKAAANKNKTYTYISSFNEEFHSFLLMRTPLLSLHQKTEEKRRR
jgi:hypothetical protein